MFLTPIVNRKRIRLSDPRPLDAITILLAVLLLSSSLKALQPTNRVTQYAHTAWSLQEGHLPNTPFALCQAEDGALWIGTESGIFRFDGVEFVPWKAPQGQRLPDEYVNALAPARGGGLWIGTRRGLSHWSGDRIETYPTGEGANGSGVAAILVDHSGTVWVATTGFDAGHLCRMEPAGLHCYGPTEGFPWPCGSFPSRRSPGKSLVRRQGRPLSLERGDSGDVSAC